MSMIQTSVQQELQQGIQALGLELDELQQNRLLQYIELLMQWNKV